MVQHEMPDQARHDDVRVEFGIALIHSTSHEGADILANN